MFFTSWNEILTQRFLHMFRNLSPVQRNLSRQPLWVQEAKMLGILNKACTPSVRFLSTREAELIGAELFFFKPTLSVNFAHVLNSWYITYIIISLRET